MFFPVVGFAGAAVVLDEVNVGLDAALSSQRQAEMKAQGKVQDGINKVQDGINSFHEKIDKIRSTVSPYVQAAREVREVIEVSSDAVSLVSSIQEDFQNLHYVSPLEVSERMVQVMDAVDDINSRMSSAMRIITSGANMDDGQRLLLFRRLLKDIKSSIMDINTIYASVMMTERQRSSSNQYRSLVTF